MMLYLFSIPGSLTSTVSTRPCYGVIVGRDGPVGRVWIAARKLNDQGKEYVAMDPANIDVVSSYCGGLKTIPGEFQQLPERVLFCRDYFRSYYQMPDGTVWRGPRWATPSGNGVELEGPIDPSELPAYVKFD